MSNRRISLRARDHARSLDRARLLIVPGLHNSGPLHWQSWLQSQYPDAVRVEQDDWTAPDLDTWAHRVGLALERDGEGPWLAVAHSFGCLALVRHLVLRLDPSISCLKAALLVAPADPESFGAAHKLPHTKLRVPTTLVASETDPWMRAQTAQLWAQRWGSNWLNLGDAGHINSASGHGPLPFAQQWVRAWVDHRNADPSQLAADRNRVPSAFSLP